MKLAFNGLRNVKGAAMLEVAILAPVLLVLGLCATDLAVYLYQRHIVITGIRDAARYVARYGASNSTIILEAQRIAVYGSPGATTSPRIANWSTSDVILATSSVSMATLDYAPRYNDSCRDANNVPLVWTASTSISYVGLHLLDGVMTLPALSASHSERCIGQ